MVCARHHGGWSPWLHSRLRSSALTGAQWSCSLLGRHCSLSFLSTNTHMHTCTDMHACTDTCEHTHVLTSSSLIPRCRAHARQTDSRQTAMLAACSFVYKHTAIAMINFRFVITITAAKSLRQASRMPTKLITIELCTASGTEPH